MIGTLVMGGHGGLTGWSPPPRGVPNRASRARLGGYRLCRMPGDDTVNKGVQLMASSQQPFLGGMGRGLSIGSYPAPLALSWLARLRPTTNLYSSYCGLGGGRVTSVGDTVQAKVTSLLTWAAFSYGRVELEGTLEDPQPIISLTSRAADEML
eukprot:474999-Pyramimonas_sp.AAC.1